MGEEESGDVEQKNGTGRARERDGGVTDKNKRGWGSVRGRVEGERMKQEGEVIQMESERLLVSSLSYRLNDFFQKLRLKISTTPLIRQH